MRKQRILIIVIIFLVLSLMGESVYLVKMNKKLDAYQKQNKELIRLKKEIKKNKAAKKALQKTVDEIDLDLSNGEKPRADSITVSIEPYTLSDDITITLQDGSVVLVKAVVNLNKDCNDYKSGKYTRENFSTFDGVIQKSYTDVISQCSKEDFWNKDKILNKIKEELVNSFGNEIIYSADFGKVIIQPME